MTSNNKNREFVKALFSLFPELDLPQRNKYNHYTEDLSKRLDFSIDEKAIPMTFHPRICSPENHLVEIILATKLGKPLLISYTYESASKPERERYKIAYMLNIEDTLISPLTTRNLSGIPLNQVKPISEEKLKKVINKIESVYKQSFKDLKKFLNRCVISWGHPLFFLKKDNISRKYLKEIISRFDELFPTGPYKNLGEQVTTIEKNIFSKFGIDYDALTVDEFFVRSKRFRRDLLDSYHLLKEPDYLRLKNKPIIAKEKNNFVCDGEQINREILEDLIKERRVTLSSVGFMSMIASHGFSISTVGSSGDKYYDILLNEAKEYNNQLNLPFDLSYVHFRDINPIRIHNINSLISLIYVGYFVGASNIHRKGSFKIPEDLQRNIKYLESQQRDSHLPKKFFGGFHQNIPLNGFFQKPYPSMLELFLLGYSEKNILPQKINFRERPDLKFGLGTLKGELDNTERGEIRDYNTSLEICDIYFVLDYLNSKLS
jgi:hypothetical protein